MDRFLDLPVGVGLAGDLVRAGRGRRPVLADRDRGADRHGHAQLADDRPVDAEHEAHRVGDAGALRGQAAPDVELVSHLGRPSRGGRSTRILHGQPLDGELDRAGRRAEEERAQRDRERERTRPAQPRGARRSRRAQPDTQPVQPLEDASIEPKDRRGCGPLLPGTPRAPAPGCPDILRQPHGRGKPDLRVSRWHDVTPSGRWRPGRQGRRSSRTRTIRFGPRRPSVSTVTPGSERRARSLLSRSASRAPSRRAAWSSDGPGKGVMGRSR